MLKYIPYNLLLIIAILIIVFSEVQATHIIGGDVTYKCLGGNLYEISLTVRRDCKNGNPPFDDPAAVGIFNRNGILQVNLGVEGRLLMPYRSDDTLNEILIKNCGIIGGDVCVHTTTYKEILELPYLEGGYILAYQRCCRNYTIVNILEPLSTGATYTLSITDEALKICNSSPVLSPYPPIYICGNQKIEFDLEAMDAEGDSLVYRMCDPYLGADQMDPQPMFPSAPPYQSVGFKPPYHLLDMIGGIPALQIDQRTGLMTGFAVNIIAQYLVAYCVEEYRDGKLLSSLRRDFQINVRICNSVPIADFSFTLDTCKIPVELNIQDNSSDQYSTIDSWDWSVVLNGNQQISNVQNPVFSFTDTGIARVQLIIRSAESCDDTIVQFVHIRSGVPDLDNLFFTICKGDFIQLSSRFAPAANYQWSPSAGLSCTFCPNPLASPDKDTRYVLTVLDGACILRDTISILVENCIVDSCAIVLRKTCLQNGMIEIAALDFKGELIIPKQRNHELFWDVKQNFNNPAISLINKNPILLVSNRAFSLTSKLYSWKSGVPRTIEFADICKRFLTDSSNLSCSGPCAELNFILSSCEDDYDLDKNLNFPTALCESICSNACQYIVGLFETNGRLIDPSNYQIKWSTGGNGSHVMLMGPYYNTLTVEVRKGDCIWYGRYWKSCKNYIGSMQTSIPELDFSTSNILQRSKIQELVEYTNSISIYNLEGILISNNKNSIENLGHGFYFLVVENGINKGVYKFVR